MNRRRSTVWLAVATGLIGLVLGANCALAQPATATAPAAAAPAADVNASFRDPQLDPREWANRFEVESREVFTARHAVLQAVGLKTGDTVADVGAGTGLYTVLFAHDVSPGGSVYAVDVAPRFIEHIAARAEEAGIKNVTPVLCTQSSVSLPPASIDVAFVCDTYHHFEHPAKTLASIHEALRPGGRLVIVDFEREQGVSSDWVLGHVRAGKDVVTAEIEAAGFKRLAEAEVKGLAENYLLVFQKAPAGSE